MTERAWRNFTPGIWQENIDVRDFIVKNYTPYEGDESFRLPQVLKQKTMGQVQRAS